jgi:general secretion pathway protein A
MYQDHFGLHADPFALSPNLRFLFRSHAHAETMAHLGYGLEQGEDIIMISGGIGTGKTLALQNLLAKISSMFRQVLVNVTSVTYPEFLKLVIDEMGETWPDGADAADLLVRLKRLARAEQEQGRKILLVVDEAQNLDVETLEGVRLLTNLGQPGKQMFQIVLAGQPGLEAKVERPELAQLRQRIRVHYRLEPLTAQETEEYLRHRTTVAGATGPLFTQAAARRIHELSGGIPRLVNHLASHALLAAFVDRDRMVDARHVAAEGMPEAPAPVEGPGVEAAAAAAAPTPAPEPAPAASVPQAAAARPARRPEPAPAGRRGLPGWAWGPLLVVIAAALWWGLPRTGLIAAMAEPERSARPEAVPAATPPPVVAAQEPAAPAPETASAEPAGDGGADVSMDVADEPPMAAPITEVARPAVVPATRHWLHVASFLDAERAGRFRYRLEEAGVGADQRDVTLDDGRLWHRVVVGPFDSADEARTTAERLQREGRIFFHQRFEE